MSDSAKQTLEKLTHLISDQQGANSVLYVSTQDIEHPDWECIKSSNLLKKHFTDHYDLAVLDLSEEALTQAAVQVVTRLRDLLAKRVLICARSEDTLYGLGFFEMTPHDMGTEPSEYRYWQFNIHDYKQVPDWLNARFWANPQNFNKYRW